MAKPVVSIQNISKKYRLGATVSHETIRDNIASGAKYLWGKCNPFIRKNERTESSGYPLRNEIWALKDVSFDVNRGEAVGIIGPNGAGKSTLLKLLSRITYPTEGRISIRGRVASLLEVGTGFHAELTGRENIFLNGAILGMKRLEIKSKFDQIVDFAGLEKFIDTPVKRYSSGMFVRLAFSVAAHLEPEILIVDEVLAVGDAAFQKKSLGKMENVANEGRTVLFVSHNMQLITSLCSRAIQLHDGRVVFDSDTVSTVRNYMLSAATENGEVQWTSHEEAPGNNLIRLKAVRTVDTDNSCIRYFRSSEPVRIQLDFDLKKFDSSLVIGFDLCTPEGVVVLRCYHNDASEDQWPQLRTGFNRIQCEIPPGLLNGGTYTLSPRISLHCIKWLVKMDSVLMFDIELTHGKSPFWTVLGTTGRPGVIAPIIEWKQVG